MDILGLYVSKSLLWFFVGVIFVVAEIGMPGFIVVFFALGAWIVATVLLFVDIELDYQIIIWVVSSLVLLFSLRKYGLQIFKGDAVDVDKTNAESKIGKTAVVSQTIQPNVAGEIKVMGSFWRAVSEVKIKIGANVLITSQENDGLTMIVKPV
ncbi:MAG: NfeD family protein [Gammaproteobacteria bacterium]|nr:MAG: NfeD family protein [Gammaproteobacteria bacterium]